MPWLALVQAVQTLLDQGTCCPLPLSLQKVFWAYDHALRITPLPDLMISAEKLPAYIFEHQRCVCINPGPFSTSNYTYARHWPATARSEISSVAVD